jgi:hypothetical protein
MRDQYLWDRTGEPDPDVVRLEGSLGALRHRRRALDYTRMPAARPARSAFWTFPRALLAAAAGVVGLVAVAYWARPAPVPDAVPRLWVATSLEGAARTDAGPLGGEVRLAAGGWVETDASARARLSATGVGMIDVEPDTRVRVVTTAPGEHRLALIRGALHAHIWAAPGRFSVETPSAMAVDLGCSYRLEADESGVGRLHVTLGWVGLNGEGVESLVPRDAICRLRSGAGPGVPYFDDAPPRLVEALGAIDSGDPAALDAAVDTALAVARPRDALSLWHLLQRVEGNDAGLVFARLAELAPPPPTVTRDLILSKDREALEAWWNTLGYGSAELFRIWKARPGR